MKVTYKTILDSVPALKKLTGINFKASEAVALMKLVKKLDSELKVYEELRTKLVAEGTEKEDFAEKFTELLNVECDEFEKVKLTLTEKMSIDAATLLGSESFVEINMEEVNDNGK